MAKSELFQRAQQQLQAGNYEEARRLFTEHEKASGTLADSQASLKKAEGLLSQGDVQGAAQLYGELLDRNPGRPEVYHGLARISLFAAQIDAARTHATAAVRVGPELGLSWALLGLVEEAEGKLPEALEHLAKAVDLSPEVYLCQYNYGRVLTVAGRAADGIEPLRRATRIEPNNRDGLIALGIAYKDANQPDRAIEALEKATKVDPKSVEAWANLADAHFAKEKYAAARDVLDRALAACGDHPALLEKALATAMMLSDTKAAIAYVERELKVVPDHEQGWLNLANLRLLSKEFDASEEAARELLRRKPRSWGAWLHLGNLFEADPARQQESEDAYRKAVELAPTEWKPLTNLAGLLIQLPERKKNEEAVPLLEKALRLVPEGEWRVHYNLALAHTRLGNRDRALELARQIVREAPASNAMVDEAKKLESNLLEAAARDPS
jgi:tetratricopeptide (TPR) repeat protein